MAFDRTDLALDTPAQNSNLPRKWSYTTADATAVVDSAGYFNNASDLLKVGDVITAKTSTGGTTAYGEYYVSANDGTTVDVNDAVSIVTSTDTD